MAAPYDLTPPDLPYKEGDPIPNGYLLREKTRKAPFIAGGVTFGVSYLASIGMSLIGFSISQDEGWRWLYAPVIGPWVAVETTKRSREGDGDLLPIVFAGLGQAVGLGLFIGGFFFPKEKKLIWPHAPTVSVAPWATSNAGGIAAGGSW